MSKLLREELSKKKKKRCKIVSRLLSQNHPSQSTDVFPQAEVRCSSFVLVQPGCQRHAGSACFFLYFTFFHIRHIVYIFSLFPSTLTLLQFEHVSIFNTCDLGWYLGALFSCFMCLLTPYFSSLTICGSFYLEKLHKLGLKIGFCLV